MVSYRTSNLFVITGGPGAGKTVLLAELQKRGYRCAPEVARQIIREQAAAGGDALPWANTERYTELMLARSVASYLEHKDAADPTFFDRGIPDVLCYARLIGLPSIAGIRSVCATYRYNSTVFVAPPWQEIYSTDHERKQSFAEAVETHRMMVDVYRECRYRIIELPRFSTADRAEFILDVLRHS
jgi:predicted ATPase